MRDELEQAIKKLDEASRKWEANKTDANEAEYGYWEEMVEAIENRMAFDAENSSDFRD